MPGTDEARLESLSNLIVQARSWKSSLSLIVVLGLVIDGASWIGHLDDGEPFPLLGTFGYLVPALIAFLLSPLLLRSRRLSWDWSGTLASTCMVASVLISLSPYLFFSKSLFPHFFALSLGIVLSIRIVFLAAVAEARLLHALLPALLQSVPAWISGMVHFGGTFPLYSALFQIALGGATLLLITIIERPLKHLFGISPLSFANAFMAYMDEGSRALEDYFRSIGQSVYVPHTTIFFRRAGRDEAAVTIPGLHPGPLGEIGGSNLPKILHDALGRDTFVLHGCSTHDFNPVSASEMDGVIEAVRASKQGLSYQDTATPALRFRCGSVHLLAQGFGDAVLIASTRSPERTDDIDASIGLAIAGECRKYFDHVAFADAHNCMYEVPPPVMPGSREAYEYIRGSTAAAAALAAEPQGAFRIGVAACRLPYSREEGFGDLGVQVLVVEAAGQTTAYVLFDGNNVLHGVREEIRAHLASHVDECEVLTTDTHVVNTVSGRNPIGMKVPVEQFLPEVEKTVLQAVADLAPAESAGSSLWCDGIVVFGSQLIARLGSSVGATAGLVVPVAVLVLVLAFLSALMAYVVLA
ncbi:DUF2070 family protein [Methanofollis fontis]|uniref:DUF2070 domain-containing protein n=1 Tax=Methanofollis fontis TaxID=2052832 RepID=A0A483CRG8_9EURY|nr:DUF2070 family protein [Methanofollis fontis]TAJ45715.1 DUF2070 domain-containing protein [Methanofollis fontis]